jgi:hypothetical protein
MLREFLSENREELIERCRFKVRMRRAPRATPRELSHGVPLFLDQLMEVFPHSTAREGGKDPAGGPQMDHDIAMTAARHGQELASHDFTIEQVVQDYGDLCQSITELAVDALRPSPCASSAVQQHAGQSGSRARRLVAPSTKRFTDVGRRGQERLGIPGNAMRNPLNTAILRFRDEARQRGSAVRLPRRWIGLIASAGSSTAACRRKARNEVRTCRGDRGGPFIAEVAAAVFEWRHAMRATVVRRHLRARRPAPSRPAVANLPYRSVTSTSATARLTARAATGAAHHGTCRGRM